MSSGVEARKPTAACSAGSVGIGCFHVTGLHRFHLELGFLAEGALERGDIVEQVHRLVIADVVERVARRLVEHPNRAFDDVIDIREVSLHVAVVEDGIGSPFRIALAKIIGDMSGRPHGPYTVKKRSPVTFRLYRWL